MILPFTKPWFEGIAAAIAKANDPAPDVTELNQTVTSLTSRVSALELALAHLTDRVEVLELQE